MEMRYCREWSLLEGISFLLLFAMVCYAREKIRVCAAWEMAALSLRPGRCQQLPQEWVNEGAPDVTWMHAQPYAKNMLTIR